MGSYSPSELVSAFLIAFGFVLVLYVHRVKCPDYYFTFGELIYGFRTSINLLAFVARFLVIFLYALLWLILSSSTFPVYLGIGLGSLLVVWPGVVVPIAADPLLHGRRCLLHLAYVVFMASCLFVTRLADLVAQRVTPLIPTYVATWSDPTRAITFLGDAFVTCVSLPIVLAVFWRIIKLLNREVALAGGQVVDDECDDTEDTKRADVCEPSDAD